MCIVLKDHANEELKVAIAASQSAYIRRTAALNGLDLQSVQVKDGVEHSTIPTTCWLSTRMPKSLCKEVLTGLDNVKHLIEYHLVKRLACGKILYIT